MAWGVAAKLGAIWVAKKVLLFGAIKAYGPGRLYRKTLRLNKYVLSRAPVLQRGGSSTLGFLFRLPDKAARVLQGAPHQAPRSSPAGVAKVAQASAEATRRSSGASSTMRGFAAAPLLQGAEAAKQHVYSKLPSAARIQSSLSRGGSKAKALISNGRAATRPLVSKEIMMHNIQQFRSSYGQTWTPAC
mmetsp:Transcript_37678/g.106447  ORF Transcript_37678/g.106447 Transcript_37678/m.106447 type:complete len:188 (+) Transcript_37678:371-934(+)